MRIFVKVKPAAKENKVEKIDDANFYVQVKELPVQGRANEAVLKLLADYFNINRLNIRLVSGFTARLKIIEIK